MEEKMCTSRCAGCFFQGRSTGTCDYIFIVGVRRPCPPGEGCAAYVSTDRKEEFMRKPNWDTEAGRKMWLEGKKDAEIADEFGISVHAVTSYRSKHWQRVKPQEAGIKTAGATAQEKPLAGMKAFDFKRGLKPPAGEPEAGKTNNTTPQSACSADSSPNKECFAGVAENEPAAAAVQEVLTAAQNIPAEVPAPENREQLKMPSQDALDSIADALKVLQDMAKGQGDGTPHQKTAATVTPKESGFTVSKPRLDEMDIMAAATEHLSGMQAVCTACAIQALWYWSGPADLRRAKKNIDWLLDHLEG